jgi:hypothetical protein
MNVKRMSHDVYPLIYVSPFQDHLVDIYEISKGKFTFDIVNKFWSDSGVSSPSPLQPSPSLRYADFIPCLIKTQHTKALCYGDCLPMYLTIEIPAVPET